MAINFPTSPSTNDTFTAGFITYKWDGAKWIGQGVTPETDRLVEGSNSLEINASNELVWTGGVVKISNSVDLTDSTVDLYSQTTNAASKTFQLFSDIGGAKTEKVSLTANGAATFSGVCKVDRTVSGDGCFHAALNGTVNASITSAGYAVFSGGEYNNEVYINGTDASTQRYLNFNRPTAGQYRATLRRDAWYLGENVGSIGNVTPTGANITLKMNGDAIFAGNCLFGTTSNGTTVKGICARSSGELLCSRDNGPALLVNRLGNDGTLVDFRGQNSAEGSISVSGTTVSLNGAHLARWSQLASGAARTEILRGSVLSNLDEMCEWGEEDNEQLNRMKVSDVEGDRNVAGVFQAWDDDDDTYVNDFYCAMTGDFVIRIAQGTTVERGDLLMSAGDGTAKPQDDDIIRSKTIAKVTSPNVSKTYADGSYCVPCVLMAC